MEDGSVWSKFLKCLGSSDGGPMSEFALIAGRTNWAKYILQKLHDQSDE